MDIDSLIQLLNNRLSVLNNSRALSFNSGDLDAVNKLDADIFSTQDSINQMRLMQTLVATANANNTTPTDMISRGIELIQNTGILLSGPLDVLNYYDITSYATDPLHEQKIADILNTIGEMSTSSVIGAYINSEAIGSPVTGAMILSSASEYNVDARLMMAIMELDSRFGTAGVAIRTLNPGNVGNNDDGDTRTYSSWDEGVNAVAEWLDRHRIVKVDPVEPVVLPVAPEVIEEVPEEIVEETSSEEIIVEPEETDEPPVVEIPPEVPPTETIPESQPVIEEIPVETPVDTTLSLVKRKRRIV